ncbi:MAG: LEA type 2 family protein [Deinococcaceae bacterium]
MSCCAPSAITIDQQFVRTLNPMWPIRLTWFLIPVLLCGCFPRTAPAIQTPKIEVEETRLLKLNPPGLGVPAEAILGFKLRVTNPNAFGMGISRIQGQLYLDGDPSGTVDIPGLNIRPTGSSEVDTQIAIALTEANLSHLVKVVQGKSITYRLDGTVSIDAGTLGKPNLGPYTVFQGTLDDAPLLVAPNFRLRPELLRFNVGLDGLTLEMGLEIQNPNILGFRVKAPLELKIGGQVVAGASIDGMVPARDAGTSYVTFRFDPLKVPQALLKGIFNFSVSGRPTLSAPGFGEKTFDFGLLTEGSVR